MVNFTEDVHHRTSTKVREVIPDFVESEYPQFVAFMDAYYKFLEQYDSLPIKSTFVSQNGVITIQTGNSTIVGGSTTFTDADVDQRLRVGSEIFRIRSIANNTHLVVYDVPVRSYYANTYSFETNKTVRQASGTLRQLPTFHDVETTIEDFIIYFRDTYLKEMPQGISDTSVLVSKVIEFYQSRGSEDAFKFLFRAIYGKEIEITYPRDNVFKTSDGEWEVPNIIKLDDAIVFSNTSLAPSYLLELRQITGLSSNAVATVLRVQNVYDGPRAAVVLYVDDIINNRVSARLLLDSDDASDGDGIIFTAFGIPPVGLETIVYEFEASQEEASSGGFIPGETISTIPTNDPLAITGQILGSVQAFTVSSGGSGYQLNDLVYPVPGYNGGYGAVGRVVSFSNTDITDVTIVDGGEGYYEGISLSVDSSGTGGSGLAGYVADVFPGNIILHEDVSAGIANNDVLSFTTPDMTGNVVPYQASREIIDYYEIGTSLDELFGAILVDDASGVNDGVHLVAPISGTDWSLTQEAVVVIGSGDWGLGNSGSAFYASNLQSTIVTIIGNLSVIPIYINGVRTEIGEIRTISISSFGSGYIQGLPTISVTPTYQPSDANGTPLPVGLVPFEAANLVANVALGQIGSIELVSGGTGYTASNTFTVNASTSSSVNGNNAVLGMILDAVFTGTGRFVDTRGQTSGDRYLQDITYYQPFSYVLTVEEDITKYGDAVRRLVHPGGALLIANQTITSELDLGLEINNTEVEVA